MASEPVGPPGFRPGPVTQGETEHYAMAHRVVPTWCRLSGMDPRTLWSSLLSGETRLELTGWQLLPAPEPTAIQEPAPPGTVRVGWVDTPRPMLLWRFPFPAFTTGALWAAWTEARVPPFRYFTLEAAALEGSWILGRNLDGHRTSHGMLATDRLEAFLAEVETQLRREEAPSLASSSMDSQDIKSQLDLVLEMFRAREAGDETRLDALLRRRFELPVKE